MALQTTDMRVVLRACDARVALASVYKLPEDAQSLEVERDRQQRLDRAGRHRQLDCDSDLDSILDFDSGLNSVLDFDRDLDSARSAKESGHYASRSTRSWRLCSRGSRRCTVSHWNNTARWSSFSGA